ncbi:MAG: hypothetical protein LBB38_02925 [Puniceicoccales bacterium]|jgi:hypothetical protein|nr:hypothetical protein [Puniceicoccales bacterium]
MLTLDCANGADICRGIQISRDELFAQSKNYETISSVTAFLGNERSGGDITFDLSCFSRANTVTIYDASKFAGTIKFGPNARRIYQRCSSGCILDFSCCPKLERIEINPTAETPGAYVQDAIFPESRGNREFKVVLSGHWIDANVLADTWLCLKNAANIEPIVGVVHFQQEVSRDKPMPWHQNFFDPALSN